MEHRKLTKEEMNRLIKESDQVETLFLKHQLNHLGIDIFTFINNYMKENDGLVNTRPIYLAGLDNDNNLWTVVNKDVKEQLSLYKHSKRTVHKWLKKYGNIQAVMLKDNDKNITWVKKMGFKVKEEDNNTITFTLKENGTF